MRNLERYMVQFVASDTGMRSRPFMTDHDELYEVLSKEDTKVKPSDYILVVARFNPEMPEEEQIEIGQMPLITVDTFLQMAQEHHVES
jgi:hypothetical protein